MKSAASCSQADIQNIAFGPFSSRFWVLRKHINCMPKDQWVHFPFYSWQCISLMLNHRDIDLVIKREKDMNNLVKYLLVKMATIDGKRDSAKKLLEKMYETKVEELRKSRRG